MHGHYMTDIFTLSSFIPEPMQFPAPQRAMRHIEKPGEKKEYAA